MEHFIATQTKTNKSLGESINFLTSRLNAMVAHQKTMDAQIAQQVSHLSQPRGHLPSQSETNPRGHINAISTMGEGLQKSLGMVLQEVVPVPDSVGIEEKKRKENLSFVGSLVLHLLSALTNPQCLSLSNWHGSSYLSLNLDSRDS